MFRLFGPIRLAEVLKCSFSARREKAKLITLLHEDYGDCQKLSGGFTTHFYRLYVELSTHSCR